MSTRPLRTVTWDEREQDHQREVVLYQNIGVLASEVAPEQALVMGWPAADDSGAGGGDWGDR